MAPHQEHDQRWTFTHLARRRTFRSRRHNWEKTVDRPGISEGHRAAFAVAEVIVVRCRRICLPLRRLGGPRCPYLMNICCIDGDVIEPFASSRQALGEQVLLKEQLAFSLRITREPYVL